MRKCDSISQTGNPSIEWGEWKEENIFYVKQLKTSYIQLKYRGNANIKRKILEQGLPNLIKKLTCKMIILCCKFRKLEELV